MLKQAGNFNMAAAALIQLKHQSNRPYGDQSFNKVRVFHLLSNCLCHVLSEFQYLLKKICSVSVLVYQIALIVVPEVVIN